MSLIGMCINLPFTLLSHTLLVLTHLRWACKFLFQQSLFHHRRFDDHYSGEMIGARRYNKPVMLPEEEEECSICLCRIEGGEDIKELRCDHLFHSDCLDRWVGYRHGYATCPLCCGTLDAAALGSFPEVGEEVLLFKFCSISSRDREAWWLR